MIIRNGFFAENKQVFIHQEDFVLCAVERYIPIQPLPNFSIGPGSHNTVGHQKPRSHCSNTNDEAKCQKVSQTTFNKRLQWNIRKSLCQGISSIFIITINIYQKGHQAFFSPFLIVILYTVLHLPLQANLFQKFRKKYKRKLSQSSIKIKLNTITTT